MALIAAKCTQCAANIEIDDSKEAGICKYCGTAFITEKAINNYNTFVTNNNNFAGANINVVGGDIDNYLKLANNAMDAGNGQEALNYANKALEIKADSSEAWIAKMKSIAFSSTIGDPRTSETTSYGDNAIRFATEADKEKITDEVYDYYMKRAITLMTLALRELSWDLAYHAIEIKLKIPESYISSHPNVQEEIAALAKLFISRCKADFKILKSYRYSLPPEELDAREYNLNLIKRGLPEEKTADIKNDDVRINYNGCYVATCVYGSYDCPEVWTLRRFRDYTLDSTWYGRLFIKCYYAISPTIVKWFGETKWFKSFWKSKLDRMVYDLNNQGVENTSYTDKY